MNNERKITVIEPIQKIISTSEDIPAQKLRVATYASVSTEQDEQQSSYEAQVDYYTRYIQGNPDWEFVSIFADEGITGTNTKKRDGFNRMIEKALSGEIDLILTKSISRFARNTVDTLQTVRKLKSAGVEVIFEKENLHTFDPKCEMMLTIMSSLAQEESRSISENVRWGHRRSMEDGNVLLPYKNFLGYRKGEDGRPEIVEEEAEIVRKIYRLFLDGYSINYIADHLTKSCIPTPSGKRKWSVSTVRSILTNEKYKGDALRQKSYTVDFLTKEIRKNTGELKQYLIENSHEPIIDPAIFDEVQKKMEQCSSNRRRNHSHSPFANRLICADCGGFYGHKVWHSRNSSIRYNVWYCNRKYGGSKSCNTPVLKEETIIRAFEMLMDQLGEPETGFSDDAWRKRVLSVAVEDDGSMVFNLADENNITVKP